MATLNTNKHVLPLIIGFFIVGGAVTMLRIFIETNKIDRIFTREIEEYGDNIFV